MDAKYKYEKYKTKYYNLKNQVGGTSFILHKTGGLAGMRDRLQISGNHYKLYKNDKLIKHGLLNIVQKEAVDYISQNIENMTDAISKRVYGNDFINTIIEINGKNINVNCEYYAKELKNICDFQLIKSIKDLDPLM